MMCLFDYDSSTGFVKQWNTLLFLADLFDQGSIQIESKQPLNSFLELHSQQLYSGKITQQ